MSTSPNVKHEKATEQLAAMIDTAKGVLGGNKPDKTRVYHRVGRKPVADQEGAKRRAQQVQEELDKDETTAAVQKFKQPTLQSISSRNIVAQRLLENFLFQVLGNHQEYAGFAASFEARVKGGRGAVYVQFNDIESFTSAAAAHMRMGLSLEEIHESLHYEPLEQLVKSYRPERGDFVVCASILADAHSRGWFTCAIVSHVSTESAVAIQRNGATYYEASPAAAAKEKQTEGVDYPLPAFSSKRLLNVSTATENRASAAATIAAPELTRFHPVLCVWKTLTFDAPAEHKLKSAAETCLHDWASDEMEAMLGFNPTYVDDFENAQIDLSKLRKRIEKLEECITEESGADSDAKKAELDKLREQVAQREKEVDADHRAQAERETLLHIAYNQMCERLEQKKPELRVYTAKQWYEYMQQRVRLSRGSRDFFASAGNISAHSAILGKQPTLSNCAAEPCSLVEQKAGQFLKAGNVCEVCKQKTYCSSKCRKADEKVHRQTECKFYAKRNQMLQKYKNYMQNLADSVRNGIESSVDEHIWVETSEDEQ